VVGEGVLHFHVTLLKLHAASSELWLVCRGSTSNCVGVQDSQEAAIAQAMRMATYVASTGTATQVHVQDKTDGPWRMVWSATDVA